MTNDRRVRGRVSFFSNKLFDCLINFGEFPFELVARFNFVRKSFVINIGSFDNGIYFPSSENQRKTRSAKCFIFLEKKVLTIDFG